MKSACLCCLLLTLLFGWSCGCREHDDYLLPGDWGAFFKLHEGQWWVLEHDRTGFRDSIYVCQSRTSWAKETGHQTCKRREDLLLQFCAGSDTARSISRVFRGLKLYAYEDYDYTYFYTSPCMFVGYYRYKDGRFYSELEFAPGREGDNVDIFRLDSLRVGNELYHDVLLLQTVADYPYGGNRFALNSHGMVKLYFAKSIGLVHAETKDYMFQGNPGLPYDWTDSGRYERVINVGIDGMCDLEEPDSTGYYNVHDGAYRLVARGG